MIRSRPALLAAAVALLLPSAPLAYASTAPLQIVVVVVRHAVVPVRPATSDRSSGTIPPPGTATPPGAAVRLAPGGAGTAPVVFTDGAPPAFVIRTPPPPDRRVEPSS